jgi:DinB family protein/SnoaL-like protein
MTSDQPHDGGLTKEASMSVVSDRRSQLLMVADAYFDGLARKNMSQVPWHPDVLFRGPLAPGAPEPLRGSATVRSWFEGLYPALGAVDVIEHYVGEGERSIATRADVHITQPPSVLRVVDRFIVDDAGFIVEQENHYDPRPALEPPPGVITAQERDLLLDLLVSSQQALIAAVVRLTPDQWTFSPADNRWSIAQCAEHLAMSEEALLGMVRGQILESPAAPEKMAMARGRDGIVVAAMRDRSQRRKTFDFLEPRSSAPAPAHFIDAFLGRRAATLQFVRETDKALHHHFAPLAPLGDLDGYQWLLLMASHTERHVAQIEEVKMQTGEA